MSNRIVFFNVGWMKNYCGLEEGDVIVGGGSYVAINNLGHEIYNFLSHKGMMYGFVETKTTSPESGRNNLHIEKIDKEYLNKDKIEDVLVVWIATNPKTKGTFVTGWYKNATVYRSERHDIKREYNGEVFGYFASAKQEDCILLPIDQRTKQVYRATSKGTGWIGQSNVWYANNPKVSGFKQEIVDYINDFNF